MGYTDYPFVPGNSGSEDPRRYPGHTEVLKYLKEFGRDFGIHETVRYETEVLNVGLVENNKWKVKSKTRHDCYIEEIYDAVVVCNGRYTEPRIADIPGKQMHSHNYRVPEPFQDQVVILIGDSASAVDKCRDIAGVAKEVYVASRSVVDETYEKYPGYDNMWHHPMIESAYGDGTMVFRNGNVVLADYHFPFLDSNVNVTVDDNCVEPLYKHVFPPVLAPWLSFVGLLWKVVPFPLWELQSKWIAGNLSGRLLLPSREEMMEDVKAFYSKLEASGRPKRIEEWRKQMFYVSSKKRFDRPETYRDDEWEDHDMILQANEDFIKYTSNRAVT
ncbi:hypothetical protein EZV62_023632 [Acer yangbiense]|uniref:Flavin-containing monooxygenase n=1 Tax=Acer yangbiense TaxID=1000413 RepID=A0A5C7H291_9ROSI|nr:hypothetical protein EZV62_023632 [Acer yangbiense]